MRVKARSRITASGFKVFLVWQLPALLAAAANIGAAAGEVGSNRCGSRGSFSTLMHRMKLARIEGCSSWRLSDQGPNSSNLGSGVSDLVRHRI